ncbi:hypothetical protein IE983_05745 [Enterobacter hormaechei]|uniref:Uncharacterized protein n=1 Tax=Enterobacter hormaechei TaxID=158836 RepID=A0A927HKQ8_9ENTR|nr:hypothetical protein [Enterobacter hormaechei]
MLCIFADTPVVSPEGKIPHWRFTVGPLNISDGSKRRNPVHASGRAAPVDEA